MKKTDIFKKLVGTKMTKQDVKFIVGGYNYTECCGDGCKYIFDDDQWWLGCVHSGFERDFCCYGK